jgi:hypothetical protein
MIVIHKKNNKFRVRLNVNARYEDAAESLRRLQKQPVGENIASIMLNKGVIGLAGADGVHVPLVHGKIIEIDGQRAEALKNASGVRLGKESDAGILWELVPGVEAVAVLLDLSMPRDVVEYSKCFPVQIEWDGIRVLDENGKPGERLNLGVYHVKDAEGEWSTLPKHSDLREVVKKYGGDDYHKVY